MTWPAPTLKFDYSNTDPQQDQHPLAHNSTNQSLNDNYRPQISANLASIQAIRQGYQGTPAERLTIVSAGGVTLKSSAAIQRRLDNDTLVGSIGTRDGNLYTNTTDNYGNITEVAPAIAIAVQPAIPALAAGGYIHIHVIAEFDYLAGQPTTAHPGFVHCGWADDNGPVTWAGTPFRGGAFITSTSGNGFATAYFTVTCAPGYQPRAYCGVSTDGSVNHVARATVMMDVFRY